MVKTQIDAKQNEKLYVYDEVGNRIAVRDEEGYVTGYTYDAVGNITQLNYPEKDKQAQFTYDAENNQISAQDEKGQTFRFSYDANGNITSKQYANNELERYQYDALNQRIRMDEYTLTGIQKTYTAYAYDANGNRTMEQNRVPTTPVRNFQSTTNTGTWGGVYKTYSYDALNRLTKEYEHDTAQSIYYSYDALGNRVTQKDNRDSLTYTYNELNQLVEKKAYNGLTSYVYDKRGNRIKESSQYTQENRRTYEWDETNRLVRGTRGPDYGLYESTYTYNGLGLRVNSTIMGPDKTKYDRDYVIDYTSSERNDIAEYNVGHTQWNGSKRVHDLSYLYNQDGERLEVNVNRYNSWSSEVVKYSLNIHEDIMESSVCYTRQDSGYNANKHEYNIWGYNTKAPTYNYDPEYRATEPYYTGHPYDGSLNIYFAENRFYDAETGTWLSKDPARSRMNWYVYCESNPGTYVDPLGLVPSYFNRITGSKEEKTFILISQYLYGVNIGMDLSRGINYFASLDEKGLTSYTNQDANTDWQLFDKKILGWAYYFNQALANGVLGENKKNLQVDPEVIKAIMARESHMGQYKSEKPSPNANTNIDIMQALDPRNLNIYDYVNIDHQGGKNVQITDGAKYVNLQSLSPGTNINKDAHNIYESNIKVTENLFKEVAGKYQYQLSAATQDLSIAVGINKYIQCIKKEPNSIKEAAKIYNANPNEKEAYGNAIQANVNAAKAAEKNGVKGSINIKPFLNQ